jgi:hypothetical protein
MLRNITLIALLLILMTAGGAPVNSEVRTLFRSDLRDEAQV